MRRAAQLLAAALAAGCIGLGLTECLTFNGLVAGGADSGPTPGDDEGDDAMVTHPAHDAGLDATTADAEGGVDLSGFPSYLSVDDAVRLCSRTFDCPQLSETIRYSMGIAYQPGNFSQCVDTFSGPLPQELAQFLPPQEKLFSCLLAATTCQGELACFPYEIVGPGDPRCLDDAGNLSVDVCTGNDQVNCDQAEGGVIAHCSSTGFPDASYCDDEVQDCITTATCDVTKFGCSGTVLTGCDVDPNDGGDYGNWGLDCAIYGQSCRPMGVNSDCYTGSVEGSGCAQGSPLASCPAAFNNTLEVCTYDSINLINCSELGATCTQLQSFAYCALGGSSCSPFDANVNTCDGSGNIKLCVRGQPLTYSCSKAGLTCGPDGDGQSIGCR